MSSKSRYNKEPRKPQQSKVDHVDGGQAELPSAEDFEEIIHVPEGRNPLQFIFLIGLLIFLLIIFIIPTAFQGALTGGAASEFEPGVVWTTPEGGDFEMSHIDLQLAMREEESFRRVMMGGQNSTPSAAEMATDLLLRQLATEAGVYVSDDALAARVKPLMEQLGGLDNYRQFTRQYFGQQGTVKFEERLRRSMQVSRYLSLTGMLAAQPKPGDIEAQWRKNNVEYAFDYLTVKAENFVEAAKAEAPGDEELQAWFAGQPDGVKSQYMTDQKWRLGSAYVPIGEAAPATLLERYPLPEGYDTVAEGEQFYNLHSYQAFKLEEPIVNEDGSEQRYQSLEDVRPLVEAAAQVKTAMAAWRTDLRERAEAGEELDLAAEAAELGVTYIEGLEPRTRSEIVEDERYGGGGVSSLLPTTDAGTLMGGVITTAKVIEVVEVVEAVEPEPKPFAEVREEVLDLWAEERAQDLALAFAEELVADTEELSAEAFAALAEDERVELGRRDWKSGRGFTGQLPESGDTFGFFLLMGNDDLYDMETGQISEPKASGDEVFIVRSEGSREKDFSQASPGEVDAARQALEQELLRNYLMAFSSEDEDELPAYLVETYGLDVPETRVSRERSREQREREAEEAGETAASDDAE